MMQYFHWDLENDGTLWKKLKDDVKYLSEVGITALWLPPAYKGQAGINDVGYGVYDLYDLGEFDQKGTIRTKYGTKDEYLDAIKEAHKYGIDIYADMVFNHKMGADVDVDDDEVKEELYRYGLWYLDFTKVDGFRLDALKHIDSDFFKGWINYLREKTQKELFTVGEYWSNDLKELLAYLDKNEEALSLFDLPLHYHFFEISNGGGYFDMRDILKDTLTNTRSMNSVSFVENHDTQIGQALQTVVSDWFKPMAYAIILLRNEGYPCVFYGDYYGISKYKTKPFKDIIDKMIYLRQNKMTGIQRDHFDDPDIIGWTFEGEKDDEGLAVILDDGPGGQKKMSLGKRNAFKKMVDINTGKVITLDEDGDGIFSVDGGSFGIYTFSA